jgi:hypothetical protein
LRREGTEKDLRVRYKDIEPMYYDIISCPACLYSAPAHLFSNAPRKFYEKINQELSGYKSELAIKTGEARDTFTVFAGYYLAFICLPICFDSYQTITAELWKKLAAIYKDCGDTEMYLYASQNALREYDYVYRHFNLSAGRLQQACYILGDLYERANDYPNAREYFFMAKSNRDGTNVMKIEADKRLEEIKQRIKKEGK